MREFRLQAGSTIPAEVPLSASRVRVSFSANGRSFRIEVRVPHGRARLDQLLPALREIDDQLMDAIVARHEAAVAKGCSTCCRVQPVPITPPEAFALARLVDVLPEPRRTAVRFAFEAAVERLHEAGLSTVYVRRPARPQWRSFAANATLTLACPFLFDDACSIYADRPFVCRQYLVTSARELCKVPLDRPVWPAATRGPAITSAICRPKAGEVRPKVPKLRQQTFETAITSATGAARAQSREP